jgi:uncharacterized repeat protein (TIGR01451 family)
MAVLTGALLVAGLIAPAVAQRSGARSSLKVALQVETLQAGGNATLTAFVPARARPGDEVVYTVTFENATDGLVDQVRITAPIPALLAYVADTAFCPGGVALFSSDDGRTYGLPDELATVGPAGTKTRVDPAAYTHVRWTLKAPLQQGAKGFARFRAVVR